MHRRWLAGIGLGLLLAAGSQLFAAGPNILWITSEDNGPHMGCYGDTYASTPSLDALAARGVIYLNAWSNAPVCAPARTTIISGLYPTSTGSEHMRSMTSLPPDLKMYPAYLREAGYYCTNNSKEDYNLRKDGEVWDESSGKAHWKNRPEGKPFFAIFNLTISHESQIRKRPHTLVHDPAKAPVPAYHPDTPEVRYDWAQYYDKMSEMDAQAGKILKELDDSGLRDDTIIFYYGDHGSGMPRSKRWPYNSGLRVPLIVSVPQKYQALAPKGYAAGGKLSERVSFVDLAPTLLSIAGAPVPGHLQGRAFMGAAAQPGPHYLYGFRGRMDERYDLVRSIRDERYVYVRQFMPHRIYGQFIEYMFQTPTTKVWHQLYGEGKLNTAQKQFWEPKPVEELYDLQNDPDEVKNLAGSAGHQQVLERMRGALKEWVLRVRDVGFLTEHEVHARSGDLSPYAMARQPGRYDLEKIYAMADLAAGRDAGSVPQLVAGLSSADSAVRYWAATGLLIRGEPAVKTAGEALRKAMNDESPVVQVAAAEALARFGGAPDQAAAMALLLKRADLNENGVYVAMQALGAIDEAGEVARGHRDAIKALPRANPAVDGRMKAYVGKLVDRIVGGGGGK